MKGGIVQISWHGSDPVLSVDFHLPSGLLATAGADRDIKLWALNRLDKSSALPTATFKANLSYHNAAVNVVRFSPSGELLASGADGGELLIWKIVQINEEIPSWKVWKTLRFHHKDVLDLEWSPDGIFLVSGSVDNTCIIWNIMKGTVEQVLADHQHYVQGVTWDPAGKYVASLSGDRTCRIYSLRPPAKRSKGKEKIDQRAYFCQHVLCKKDAPPAAAALPTLNVDDTPQKQVSASKQYLFYDENMPSFFRRLAWSPDGSFLLIPSGVEKKSGEATSCSVSYIVSRKDLSRPALQLPAASKPVVAARFCPVIFSLSPKKSWKHDTSTPDIGAFKLPYRLVFAVATLNSVFIYDTEQSCPITIFGGLHYAPITDLAWSSDARFLAASSQDGYCTLVGFDEGDLGLPMPLKDLPPNIASLRLSCLHDNCSLSTSINMPEQATDSTFSESGDLLHKTAVAKKDSPLKMEHSPVGNSKKPQGMQSDSQVKPQKITRITPKPILEYLQQGKPGSCDNSGAMHFKECLSSDDRCGQNTAEGLPQVLKDHAGQSGPPTPEAPNDHVEPSGPPKIRRISPKPILEHMQPAKPESGVQSGALYFKECHSSNNRCGQDTAETPTKAPKDPLEESGLSGRITCGKRLEVVQECSELDEGYEQGITPASEIVGKESSAMLQEPNAIEAKSDMCQKGDEYRRELSSNWQGLAESAQGPSTPQGPCTLKSLKDQIRSRSSSNVYGQKPRDQQAHMYVRPLKFRRISPNLISGDTDHHKVLKPATGDTSINGCPGLQPI